MVLLIEALYLFFVSFLASIYFINSACIMYNIVIIISHSFQSQDLIFEKNVNQFMENKSFKGNQ